MAEKIKGFTIELGLDALKVDSGLKDVRKSISAMNNEMKSNMSVFDRSERSMKKYETQLGGLNKKLELQRDIVEKSHKHYEKMVKVHGEGSREAIDAANAYNRENAQLNNLERHVQRVTKEMREFERQQIIQNSTLYKSGKALDDFGNKLEDLSNKARSIGGDLTKKVTAPIVGVATMFGGAGFKRAMSLEQVEFMMDHMSDSAEEYESRMKDVVDLVTDTRFGTAEIGNEYAKLIGAGATDDSAKTLNEVAMNLATFKSDDSLIPRFGDMFTSALQAGSMDGTMINQFASAGVDVLKVLGNQWGMSTEEVRKVLRQGEKDISDVLDDLSAGILKGTDGVNGSTKAMGGMLEGSGKLLSGQIKNFFAAISQTGERLIKETGLFDGVKNALDELRNMLKSGELDALFMTVFKGAAKALEALVDVLRKVFKWFSSLNDSSKDMIGKFIGLAAIIGPIITAFGIFGGIIAKVSKAIGGLFKWIAPLTKGLGFVGKGAGGAGKSVGLFGRAASLLGGPIGIAIGVITLLVTAFTVAYKKSETFRKFVHLLGEKFKEVFFGLVDWIKPGLDAVTNFFKEVKEKILSFINEEGAQFIEAWQNIWGYISPILGWIADKVKWAFETIIKPVIGLVMKAIEFVIKTVWDNIKGIITGTLDVIMGAVKIFSGLFTGDFTKMWEGVKQLFFGAIQVIWNWIQLQFIGRILKGIGGFVKGFWTHIKNMWSWVKNTFSTTINSVYNNVTNSFVGRIISSIVNFVKNFRSNISNMWTNVKTIFSQYISSVYSNVKNSFVGRIISSIINFVKNFKSNITNLWRSVKTTFSNQISSIRSSIENSFVGRIISSVTTMKTKFVGIAKDMWKGVKEQFGNIVDGAKKLPGKIGDGITKAKDKATGAMKKVGNSMIEWAGKPFNKVVDGVNWVTGKLGVKTKVAKWDYPQYAKGTKGSGHPGGLAIVGDKFGRELINLPDGQSFISPGTDTLMNLPKGTHVIPNRETEKILDGDIPMYAKGTKGWFSNFKSAVGDVWDYVKNPGKIVTKLIDKISLKSGMAEIPGAIVKGGFNYVKDKPVQFLKNMFKENEDNNPSAAGKPAFKWPVTSHFGYRFHPIHKTMRLHAGTDFGAPTGAPIPSQSTGTVNYAGRMGGFGNLVRVKSGIWEMYYAHLSKIMAKVGQKIQKGEILGLVGSTGDSTGPHLHYETRKNGKPVNPMSLKGFKTGGVIKNRMMAMLGEDGEEIVIPTNPNRRTDAMKLLALAAKKIGVDGGNYTRPSGISGNGGGRDEEINLLRQQVQLLMELVTSSRNIERKPVLTEGDIQRSYDKMDARESSKHSVFTGKPRRD